MKIALQQGHDQRDMYNNRFLKNTASHSKPKPKFWLSQENQDDFKRELGLLTEPC
jgi:hypothetical protein